MIDVRMDACDVDRWYFRSGESMRRNLAWAMGGWIQWDQKLLAGTMEDQHAKLTYGVRISGARMDLGWRRNGQDLEGKQRVPLNASRWERIGFGRQATDCELWQVLDSFETMEVLGDYTKTYEALGIDTVEVLVSQGMQTSPCPPPQSVSSSECNGK